MDVDAATRAGRDPLDLAHAYLAGGARLLQLRAKHLNGAAFRDLATRMTRLARDSRATLIVNDRADIARLAEADGVHVGQDDLTPTDVRQITGGDMLVGLSTHTDAQIEAALEEPISYLAIGPVFPTTTKETGYDRVGYAAVRHAAGRAATRALPVVAIGGITLETAAEVIAAGASSLAVITDLMIGDPEVRIRQYLAAVAL